MDPLSISAGIIAVATVAAQVGLAFAELRALCVELPGRLHALNNEVADIEVVLYQVAAVINERSCLPQKDQTTIPQLLRQASTRLNELKEIIQRLASTCARKRVITRASAWRKEQPRLNALQDDIKTIKSSLNVMLGASNSRDMIRVRLELETLSTITAQSMQTQSGLRNELLNSLARQQEKLTDSLEDNYNQVDQRISRVERMLHAQSAQIQASQLAQIGPLYSEVPPPYRRRRSRPTNQSSGERSRARSVGVGVRLTRYASTVCRPGCSCACHSQQKFITPGLVDRVLEQLFVGYAGLPLLSPRCNTDTCDQGQNPQVSVEYWFPLGFCWSQIIRLQLAYEPYVGPSMQLSTLRRVPDYARCVIFALEGNIEGLKGLFKHGSASPRDVSSSRGYSLLRWALYGQQYETCKFLISAGADCDYKPVSPNDDCPSDKACDIILRGGLPQDIVEILKCLAKGSDFVEDQNFAPIHKIVLGLSLQDLRKEILQDLHNIDIPDAMGRTALEWAAARGDVRAVTMLLSYGADPNIMDKKLNTPVTLAANQNHTTCVRLLLEAGALPDPPLPNGVKFGSSFNCAARNAFDPLLLKTLLDFNADIERAGVDGFTPLLHVARSSSAGHAMLLLEYGANINVTSKDGRTPLTTAIVYNNYTVLQLLLDRWYKYSECPRLKGPHLLELVAQYADMETMSILSSASYLRLNFDKDYVLHDAATRLRERSDVTEELIHSFEDLLKIINQSPPSGKSRESEMEAGFLAYHSPETETHNTNPIGGYDESDEDFEDAHKSFTLASDNIDCLVFSLKKRATL